MLRTLAGHTIVTLYNSYMPKNLLPLILAFAVGFAPTAMPCLCVAGGSSEATNACCGVAAADTLPLCCRAKLSERQQASEHEGCCSQHFPPIGCCCAPAKPVATVADAAGEPVVIWAALPSANLPGLVESAPLVAFDQLEFVIAGNRLRSLLCVWRN